MRKVFSIIFFILSIASYDTKSFSDIEVKIINDNREKAIEYKQGKEKLFGFFVGQAMKASGGKANPQLINEILKKKL